MTASLGVLDFHISYECTHHCVFCEQSADMRLFRKSPVTAEEIARVLAVKRKQGLGYVLFSGGEPTLHPKILGILAAARSAGFRTAVVSNGWRLGDRGFAKDALPLVDDLWLSVHGDTPELHDGLTRRRGAHARLLQAFRNAEDFGHRSLLTSTTVTRANAGRVRDILRSVLAYPGVSSCLFSQLFPDGAGGDDFERMVVPLDWWRESIPALARIGEEKGARLLFCGLPLCALGRHWESAFEVNYYPATAIGRIAGYVPHGMLRGSRLVAGLQGLYESECSAPGKGRRKPDACGPCVRKGSCGGVAQRYLDCFGGGGLRPMKA